MFESLGLHPELVKAVTATGYTTPTAVQLAAIPAAILGGDLLVSSQTGSGKTAAFLLPSMHRLTLSAPAVTDVPRKHGQAYPRILVLTPTRELALQVTEAALTFGKSMRLKTVSLVGGAPFGLQLRALQGRVDIIVATPGRLIDHLERGNISLSQISTLILDEADRMLDMGFVDDIESIVKKTPDTRQTLLFSATLEGVVGALANRMTRKAQRIEIESAPASRAKIDQSVMFADDFSHKSKLLDALLADVNLQQAVVFTATKRSADELSDRLRGHGHQVDALHGDMRQRERNRTLDNLRLGRLRVLVATDVAARGIDVPGITHVINFDLPRQAEDYVHRIGRTGRAGREGTAISLAGHSEKRLIRDIERYTDQRITVNVIAGLEPRARPDFAARPGAGRPPSGRPSTGRPSGPSRFANGAPKTHTANRSNTGNSSFADRSGNSADRGGPARTSWRSDGAAKAPSRGGFKRG